MNLNDLFELWGKMNATQKDALFIALTLLNATLPSNQTRE